MSVAFRRESDEEHKEPRFELPIPPGPNLVTARGIELLQARNDELEAELDNTTSDERRAELQRDLRYWRARLATAQVAPVATGESVAIGTIVTIAQDGEERRLEIVGHDESDPAAGKIAFGAPLARLLIGGEEGDEIDHPGHGPITILAIEPAGT